MVTFRGKTQVFSMESVFLLQKYCYTYKNICVPVIPYIISMVATIFKESSYSFISIILRFLKFLLKIYSVLRTKKKSMVKNKSVIYTYKLPLTFFCQKVATFWQFSFKLFSRYIILPFFFSRFFFTLNNKGKHTGLL